MFTKGRKEVSIPHRYSTNSKRTKSKRTKSKVSIPHRYSTNQMTGDEKYKLLMEFQSLIGILQTRNKFVNDKLYYGFQSLIGILQTNNNFSEV